MIYDFEPITWNNRLAFNKTDCTIRREATDDIPWGNKKWQTSNCSLRMAGTQKQIWDNDKKELVWVKTPDIVFFAGMAQDKQDALVPVVARGLTAMLIRAARLNSRGKWIIENETEICERYRKMKEDGAPFDSEELAQHFNEEINHLHETGGKTPSVIGADLYELIADCLARYTGMLKSVIMQDDDLLDCFKGKDAYDNFMKYIEKEGTPPSRYRIGCALIEKEVFKTYKTSKADLLRRLSKHYFPDEEGFNHYNHDNTKVKKKV